MELKPNGDGFFDVFTYSGLAFNSNFDNIAGAISIDHFQIPIVNNASNGETWFYGVQSSGLFDAGHSFAYNPNTNIIYEIHTPNPDADIGSGVASSGLTGTQSGNTISIGYKWNLNNQKDRIRFINFKKDKTRPPLYTVPVYVPNSQRSTMFFESWVGKSWDYSLFGNNCKHFIVQGLSEGGAITLYTNFNPVVWKNTNIHYFANEFNLK